MATRSRLLLLLAVWMACSAGAESTGQPGDAPVASELERHESAVIVLEHELLALIEVAPQEERFDLYWTYNALIGAWVQVDRLQALLESASLGPMSSGAALAAIREQAQFTLWEIGEADRRLAARHFRLERTDASRIKDAVRSLLWGVHTTIGRYWLAVMPPST